MDTTISQTINRYTHIAIIHDSIFNSVFDGQVLQPLQLYAQQNPNHAIVIISFEKTKLSQKIITNIIPNNFTFIQIKKTPFMGRWSLAYAVHQLKQTLSSFAKYSVIARGPIAGYLAINAQTKQCEKITIQARGLLAEEYGYAHQKDTNVLAQAWHTFRKQLYTSLEKQTYSYQSPLILFQAVSPALKEYLIKTYGTLSGNITIAQDDIPLTFTPEKKMCWRKQIRNQLNINQDAYVYCYNGSAKPWQCPEKVIQFFTEKLHHNPQAILLILSQDTNVFLSLIKKNNLSETHYRIAHVPHNEIFNYLASTDAGLLFREPHIINWISRPTKALEYQAVQLKIIHNNTVAYLH